jgi:hypothetical protein
LGGTMDGLGANLGGKLIWPNRILNSPARLVAGNFGQIKLHAILSYRMVPYIII